ncbi:MAG TPA: hypothetical protein VIB01_06945, partial [Steroidobacteraceae bacterium]
MQLARFVACAWLCGFGSVALAQEVESTAPAEAPAAELPEGQALEVTLPEGETVDAAAVEAEIAAQELSGEAEVRLDAARESVVQIRGFFDDSESSAFHGSGFAVGDGRRIVTNYHVVAPAVLY